MEAGGLTLLLLQGEGDEMARVWEALLLFGAVFIASLTRGLRERRTHGGPLWEMLEGWRGRGQDAPSGAPSLSRLLGSDPAVLPGRGRQDQLLTAPPMPDPAARRAGAAPAAAYQAELEQWLAARGLELSDENLLLAVRANPFRPAPDAAGAAEAEPRDAGRSLPELVQEQLWLYSGQWWVAGGWALDLWLGRQTRPHSDIEIAIPRHEQEACCAFLSQFRFQQVLPDRPPGERLQLLPPGLAAAPEVHELHGRRYSGASLDPGGLMALELLLNEVVEGQWYFRRNELVSLPLDRLGGREARGIPFLAPEVVLLYKAGSSRGLRPVDEQDFNGALPQLDAARRAWLSAALATAHPGHPWIERLSAPPA